MTWWRRLAIRWRITIGSVLVGAVLLTGAGVLLGQQVEQAQLNSDKKILYGASTPYIAQVRDHPDRIDQPVGEERLVVLDPAGRDVASNLSDPLIGRLDALHRLSEGSHFATFGGRDYLLVVRIVSRPEGDWRIVAVRDESSTTEVVLGNLTNIILVGGVVLLVGIGLAAWLLTTAALRPVTTMRRRAETLEAIGSEELLPVPPARDELSALATTLNAFLTRVRDAAAREKQVVADASHELRTPVAVLRSQLELAARHRGDAERLADDLALASATAERLSGLASNLLVLSALEADRTAPRGGWRELVDEFTAASDRALLLAAPSGIDVDFEVEDPEGSDVFAITPAELGRVIDNLVRNAIAAGGTSVRARLARTAERLRLVVEDDGPGMPEEFLDAATDRFTRATRDADGSGLGLAIVRTIATRGGGGVGLRNRAPHGLEATVTIRGAE